MGLASEMPLNYTLSFTPDSSESPIYSLLHAAGCSAQGCGVPSTPPRGGGVQETTEACEKATQLLILKPCYSFVIFVIFSVVLFLLASHTWWKE